MERTKHLQLRKIIANHIYNNNKEYILLALIFIIGIFLGVMFINNVKEVQMSEIKVFLNEFIEKLKSIEQIESFELLKTSLLQNIFVALLLWFFGTTVIGIPVVFGIILYRGFCLGYTISALIVTIGLQKGILFILLGLLLQNIIFIPAIIAIGVSGLKLYKTIVKERKKDSIKIEVLRHTMFSLVMLFLLCISSIIEILVSTNILQKIIKYF